MTDGRVLALALALVACGSDVAQTAVRPDVPAPFDCRKTSEQVTLPADPALGAVSGVGLAYGGGAALTRRLSDRFRVGIGFFGPLVGGSWETSTGTAVARQELAWVEATFVAVHAGVFDLGATLGIGAYHLKATAEVEPPLVSQSDEVWSGLGSIGPNAVIHATESLSFGADFAVMGLTPRPGIAVAEDEMVFQMPVFRVALGLGVEF